jgi:hypothetical protein
VGIGAEIADTLGWSHVNVKGTHWRLGFGKLYTGKREQAQQHLNLIR